jgi:hypothetical protein
VYNALDASPGDELPQILLLHYAANMRLLMFGVTEQRHVPAP